MTAPIRLGMLTPSSNTTLEPVTTAMLAGLPSVSLHFSRFRVTEIAVTPGCAAAAAAAAAVRPHSDSLNGEMMVARAANFRRPSAAGRSPRFHDSMGPTPSAAISGIAMGRKVALKKGGPTEIVPPVTAL